MESPEASPASSLRWAWVSPRGSLLQASLERGLELGQGHGAKGEHGAETTEQSLRLTAVKGFVLRVFFACRL